MEDKKSVQNMQNTQKQTIKGIIQPLIHIQTDISSEIQLGNKLLSLYPKKRILPPE